MTRFKSKNYRWLELGEIMAKNSKNSKKTTRGATSTIWRIFAELNKPKRKLSQINLTSTKVSLF